MANADNGHTGFNAIPGKTELNMTEVVLKLYHRQVLYCHTTTNKNAHVVCLYPEIKTEQVKQLTAGNQWTLDESLNNLPSALIKLDESQNKFLVTPF